MQRQSNAYTFFYIAAMSLIAALILSVSSESLKVYQDRNAELEVKKNILTAVGLMQEGCDIEKCYADGIRSLVINAKGETVTTTGITAEKINLEEQLAKKPEDRLLPVYRRVDGGKTIAYCVPIVGKGLWSTLYGYIALEPDLDTVKGLTFYKHGETPGLGAEIEKEWFQKNFTGKKIFDKKGSLVSVKVVKGKVKPASETLIHEVDGMSGATLTGDGVTKLLKDSLMLYEPYVAFMKKTTVAKKGK